jgi:hypothetical protein
MSSKPVVPSASPARPGGSEPTVLRLHDATAGAIGSSGPPATAHDDPEAAGIWKALFEEFLDVRAVQRFHHYAESHSDYRWKPSLALVLPEGFSAERRAHLRDLAVAVEVLASVMDHYSVAVISDSPDASRLFRTVVPFSAASVSRCAGALVLLSRRLNDEVSAIRPSRYVAADPCAYRKNQQRIVFTAGGVETSFAPAQDSEIARDARECVAVFLDEDDEVPEYLAALGRLRVQGVPLSVTLSTRADEDFARRIHAAFAADPRVEVRDPEPRGFHEHCEFRISNNLVALLTQRRPTRTRYLFHRGEFWRVGANIPSRSDFYLCRGEESDAHGLLGAWLGRRDVLAAGRTAVPQGGVVEPMVSIVVPAHDGNVEIVRLAESIYAQDYPWIEVVFVSSGGPPETLEAVRVAENYLMKRRYSVRIIELARASVSAAARSDIGIRASRGDLVCVLRSDDWIEPGFFEFLRRKPWRDDTLYCPATNAGQEAWEPADLAAALRRQGNFLGESGVCFARSLFDRAGGLDHQRHESAAFALWWRSALAGARAERHAGRLQGMGVPVRHEVAARALAGLGDIHEPSRGGELIPWR